jgi:Zn-dependent M32 family carboxypeptidase
MQVKTFIAAAALAFVGASAFAQEATSDAWMGAAATKSRAEVQAELQQARATGLTKSWSAGYIEKLNGSKTRAEVVAATIAARDSGELESIDSEAYAFNGKTAQPAVRLAKSAR